MWLGVTAPRLQPGAARGRRSQNWPKMEMLKLSARRHRLIRFVPEQRREGGTAAWQLRGGLNDEWQGGCFWLFLAVSGCFWMFLAISGCFWLFLVVFGCLWLFLTVFGSQVHCSECKSIHGNVRHDKSTFSFQDLNEVYNSMQLRIRWSIKSFPSSNILSKCAEWLISRPGQSQGLLYKQLCH